MKEFWRCIGLWLLGLMLFASCVIFLSGAWLFVILWLALAVPRHAIAFWARARRHLTERAGE